LFFWLDYLEYIDYLWNWKVDMHVAWMRKINNIAIHEIQLFMKHSYTDIV